MPPGCFGRQPSFTDIYHTIQYHARVLCYGLQHAAHCMLHV